ncbi:hypothetical protein M514_04069, partial [Trichuris suis]
LRRVTNCFLCRTLLTFFVFCFPPDEPLLLHFQTVEPIYSRIPVSVRRWCMSSSDGFVSKDIDVRRCRFPHCIVWTPIPILTWFLPFVGHVGIALSSGIIHDFAGSYFVSEDDMAFSEPYRYIQCQLSKVNGKEQCWDEGVKHASEVYRGRSHNLVLDNCHSHVCLALNRMAYNHSTSWSPIVLCLWMFFKGRYVRAYANKGLLSSFDFLKKKLVKCRLLRMLLSFPQMALLLSAVRLIGIADLLDEQAMVKLTSQLIENALQYINACRDRELVLRGYKIPVIENLGATHDQFDTIDFTNNDLKRIENFPTLRRVKSLFFTNNRISGLDSSVAESLPNLKTLVLTNNVFEELGDLEPLASFPKLEYLSLMGNPVTHKPMYRLFVIFTVPQVRVLDYKRVRAAGEGAAAIKEQIVKSAPPANIPEVVNGQELRTASEIRSIKEAINKAKTIEEVNRLKAALEAGVLPDAPMEVVSEDASLTCN